MMVEEKTEDAGSADVKNEPRASKWVAKKYLLSLGLDGISFILPNYEFGFLLYVLLNYSLLDIGVT
jgi:hypothetical protein